MIHFLAFCGYIFYHDVSIVQIIFLFDLKLNYYFEKSFYVISSEKVEINTLFCLLLFFFFC